MVVIDRLRGYRMSLLGRRWLGRGLAIVGFSLLAKALLDHGIQGAGGGGGIDAIAYWTAAGNVRDGLPLYSIPEGSFAAYAYPPPLAQALVPLSFLPMPIFVWLWRAIELVSLRVAVGSWTLSGIALLVLPPVIAEVDAGNVHLIMAAACALAMRGVALPVAPATLLKFASVPLAPLGWRFDRRGLLIGIGATAIVVGASALIARGAWTDYVRFLGTTGFPRGWYNLAENVPLPLRLLFAASVGLAATRWIRLAPIAVLFAYPVVWFHALSTLVALVAPVRPSGARERHSARQPAAENAALASATTGSQP
jgi:Protein of unknown function (DUF2029).